MDDLNDSIKVTNNIDKTNLKILNKALLFDTSKINEEVIDKIIESLNKLLNDEYYIDHPGGTNSFTLKREDGR